MGTNHEKIGVENLVTLPSILRAKVTFCEICKAENLIFLNILLILFYEFCEKTNQFELVSNTKISLELLALFSE